MHLNDPSWGAGCAAAVQWNAKHPVRSHERFACQAKSWIHEEPVARSRKRNFRQRAAVPWPCRAAAAS
eukprot:2838950-Prymnesium_polylepis.1